MTSVIPVLALITAIAATVLAFIFIVPEKKRKSMNKLGKFLHDTVNFKYLIIEKILQAFYILATAFVIMLGFFMLFYVQEGYRSYYYSSPDVWYGGYGLLVMILGPIVIRIAYEFVMMTILLIKNVIQINNKMKSDSGEATDIFATPKKEDYVEEPAYVEPAEPVAEQEPVKKAFCIYCGGKLAEGPICPTCGKMN